MAVEFDIARNGFAIRPARPADAKGLRMLLPAIEESAFSFVAVDGAHQLMIGAAAATGSYRLQPLPGPGVLLQVIAPCRGHGIATSLLVHIERSALEHGAKALYAAQRAEKDSEEMHHWQRLGFAPVVSVEEHVLPIDHFETTLGPLVDRMRAKGRIPAGARIIPLYQADQNAVLQLHLDNMGGNRRELHYKLQSRGPNTFLPRHSRVLLLDGRVKGCLLAHRISKEAIVIDADIVAPELRGGWANALLKLEAFRGAPPGVVQFQFTSFDHYGDTRSFTKKLGGTTTRTTLLMMRAIPTADLSNTTNIA